MMLPGRLLALSLSVFMVISVTVGAKAELRIVTSIKPVHSLVSLVAGDKAAVSLLLAGAASPHTHALTPRQAQDIQDADAVVWIGGGLEEFLEKPLQTIGKDALQLALITAPNIETLAFREGGAFEAHHHDDHNTAAEHDHHDHHDGHEDHDGHTDHKDHKGHDEHEEHNDHAHHEDHKGHDEHDGHAHSPEDADPHIWLSPENAKAMLYHIADGLGGLDPENRAVFVLNAEQAAARIDQVAASLAEQLSPYREGEFIVFHDAYHYFEQAFGLQAAGAITINPERMPGAQRISEIRSLLQDDHIRCVFTEPQFTPKIITTILEGTDKKAVQIDPLGTDLTAHADMYFNLLTDMKASFLACLS